MNYKMRKLFILSFFSLLTLSVCPQTMKSDSSMFNLDFERTKNKFPNGWDNFGTSNYLIYSDSIAVNQGKYSVVIEFNEKDTAKFKALSFTLPSNYDGKQITLSGYIKTENVTDGFAGLWMRIDPMIAFDNMQKRGIKGTTDWTKYEVTLAMNPAKTKQIVVGGLLAGKGKIWLDNFHITIDGKEIYDMKPYENSMLPAEKDDEFYYGSRIQFPLVNDRLTDNLELLGKVWGFLKYYHPAVAAGNYNWDYELFRILPAYLKTTNTRQRDELLVGWIDKYGKVPTCSTCKDTSSDVFMKPDLSWIVKSKISNSLKDKINEIYQNRNQGKHFYISMAPWVNNPVFTHEEAYSYMPYPDAGFRLLSLYRFWNMIQYFDPNKNITNKNWTKVLKDYIPLFIGTKDKLEYELAALRIIGEVNDTHANLWGGGSKIAELRGDMYSPFRVQFVEGKLVVTDYYNPEYVGIAQLKIGDIITNINHKPVESIIDSLRPYYPASNQAARLRDIAGDLLRSNKDSILITYLSSGQKKQKSLLLYNKSNLKMYGWNKINKEEKCYKLLDGNIGYITLATIKAEDISTIKESFKSTTGIIIDIRNYPSTFVPFSLGSYFVTDTVPFVKFTEGSVDNPGRFTFRSGAKIPKGVETYNGKLVVLVNEFTQSQAEYTTMAFRAGRNTTIVGSTTAGADGNVSPITLPGGLSTYISGIGVFYPNGTPTQRVGIIPDVKIEPTINGIKNGKDELLEKGIEIINNCTTIH